MSNLIVPRCMRAATDRPHKESDFMINAETQRITAGALRPTPDVEGTLSIDNNAPALDGKRALPCPGLAAPCCLAACLQGIDTSYAAQTGLGKVEI